jgi:hypothetical protein
MLKCKIAYNSDQDSNHLSIETIITIEPQDEPHVIESYNYAKADWKIFKKNLKKHAASIISNELKSQADIDACLAQLISAIQKAVKESIPIRKPCLHSKR